MNEKNPPKDLERPVIILGGILGVCLIGALLRLTF